MLGVVTLSKFACDNCGSVSVVLPEELIESAFVRCSGCGREFGRWGQFKQEVERIISAQPRGMNGSAHAGFDTAPRIEPFAGGPS
ncbi:MAG: hypothetical protein ACK4VM_03815 [Bosea sp. (in: a-proteobacteria)]